MAFLILMDGRDASLDPIAIMTLVAGLLPGLIARLAAVLIRLLKTAALIPVLNLVRSLATRRIPPSLGGVQGMSLYLRAIWELSPSLNTR
jgi:hypothetical protein